MEGIQPGQDLHGKAGAASEDAPAWGRAAGAGGEPQWAQGVLVELRGRDEQGED